MNSKKYEFSGIAKNTGFIICLSMIVLLAGSCTPLRRKFTRKKKDNKEQNQKFIPVLDPIDYPEKVTLVEDKYKYHYSLWKVWDKDFLQNVAMDSSEKRQKYLLMQSIGQLEEMGELLSEVKRARLIELTNNYRSILQEYDRSAAARNKNALKRKIERSAREVRNTYAPKIMEIYWNNEHITGSGIDHE